MPVHEVAGERAQSGLGQAEGQDETNAGRLGEVALGSAHRGAESTRQNRRAEAHERAIRLAPSAVRRQFWPGFVHELPSPFGSWERSAGCLVLAFFDRCRLELLLWVTPPIRQLELRI